MQTRHPLALVTGAVYGLGRAYADELAARGYDLFLIDLPDAPLTDTATAIQAAHSVEVSVFHADLSVRAQVEEIATLIQELPRLDLLINNAGFMMVGQLDRLVVERMQRMIQLHTMTVVQLSRAAVEKMRPVRRGGIINVSSIAGFSAARHYATYNATKAFIQVFTRSLALELDDSGITVLAVCPGPMPTNIFEAEDAPNLTRDYPHSSIIWTSPQFVARGSLERLGKQVVWVPGWLNKLIVATSGFNTRILDHFT